MLRAFLCALAGSLFFVGEAEAQSFCSVSNAGRERCWHTADMCRQQAAPDGFCVYRPSSGPPARTLQRSSVADSIEQGRRDAQERRLRELEIERRRLENEALRQSVAPPPRSPPPSSSAPSWAALITPEIAAAAANGYVERPRADRNLSQEAVERCEPTRAMLNSWRAERRRTGTPAPDYGTLEGDAKPYYDCLYPQYPAN